MSAVSNVKEYIEKVIPGIRLNYNKNLNTLCIQQLTQQVKGKFKDKQYSVVD
jgi:hypothetical protein